MEEDRKTWFHDIIEIGKGKAFIKNKGMEWIGRCYEKFLEPNHRFGRPTCVSFKQYVGFKISGKAKNSPSFMRLKKTAPPVAKKKKDDTNKPTKKVKDFYVGQYVGMHGSMKMQLEKSMRSLVAVKKAVNDHVTLTTQGLALGPQSAISKKMLLHTRNLDDMMYTLEQYGENICDPPEKEAKKKKAAKKPAKTKKSKK